MSGDIEDFLRRAAQRRQARQGNQPAPPPTAPRRPEYSDSRRERAPQAVDDDDELVVAEVIEEPLSRKLAELRRAQATAQAMREATEQANLSEAKALQVSGVAATQPSRANRPASFGTIGLVTPPASSADAMTPATNSAETIAELHQALRSPQGLRNAILLHEILARPEHRW